MVHEAWDSARVRTVDLPGSKWYVMDASQDGEHLLLAQMAGDTSPTSYLYVTGPDGKPRLPIYSYAGKLVSALFSPDGRSALVIASQGKTPYTGESGTQDIVLANTG